MAFFLFKNEVFSSNTCQFYKKQYFYNPVRVSLAILMQIKKKNLFLFQLQICGSSSACKLEIFLIFQFRKFLKFPI